MPLMRSVGRWTFGTAACLLGLAVASRGADAQAPPPARPAPELRAFHDRLAVLEAGRTPHVVVLQIGDSHTAADYLTGRLRSLMQARFGNGGRGMMAPGVPYAHFRTEHIRVAQAGKWKVLSSSKANPDQAPYGISGYVLRSTTAGDRITLDDRSGADDLAIGYMARPDSGTIEVIANGETFGKIELAGTADARQEIRLNLARNGPPPPGHAWMIEIRTNGDGPVEITDLALSRVGGVQVVNLGFIGAQIGIMGRWHWPTVAAQIERLDPALILVAFGTNEGFAPTSRIAAGYEAQFEQRLAALKAAAPMAALVVVGPPDAARYPRFCLPPPAPLAARPATGGPPEPRARPSFATRAIANGVISAAWPPAEPPESAICKPLAPEEQRGYEFMLASQDRALCRWHTPPALPLVRDIQRRVAARQGALFFDWSELFEGECGIDRWARQGLAARDRVHFRQAGYVRAADRLHERLMAGYPAKRDTR